MPGRCRRNAIRYGFAADRAGHVALTHRLQQAMRATPAEIAFNAIANDQRRRPTRRAIMIGHS